MTTSKTPKPDVFEQYAADLAAAEAKAKLREQAFADAHANLATIEEKFRTGDDTPTPLQYAEAKAAVEAEQFLRDDAVQALAALRDAEPVRLVLADAIAPVLADVLGVPVKAVHTLPTTTPKTATVYVVQDKPATFGTKTADANTLVPIKAKRYSGEVILHPFGLEIDKDALRRVLEARGIGGLFIKGTSPVRLTVGWLYPEGTPEVESAFTTTDNTRRGVLALVSDLAAVMSASAGTPANILAKHHDTTTARGKRTVTATVTIEARPLSKQGARGTAADVAASAVTSRRGLFYEGLGRIIEATLQPASLDSEATFTATFKAEAKVSA